MRAGDHRALGSAHAGAGTSPVTLALVLATAGAAAARPCRLPLRPRPGFGALPAAAGLLGLRVSACFAAMVLTPCRSISPQRLATAYLAAVAPAAWIADAGYGLSQRGIHAASRWTGASGASRSMMPPWRSFCVGFWCFFIMLICSTTHPLLVGSTRSTLPRLPALSPGDHHHRVTLPHVRMRHTPSDDLGRERDDLGELLARAARAPPARRCGCPPDCRRP